MSEWGKYPEQNPPKYYVVKRNLTETDCLATSFIRGKYLRERHLAPGPKYKFRTEKRLKLKI